MVHGWPDSHTVWDLVANRVHEAGFHVATFDVRGVGGSTRPCGRRPFALAHMAADIGAVVSATTAGPVHLVGHDWGGIEGWEFTTSPIGRARLATYTTLSGPNLDHVGQLFRTDRRAALVQGSRSLYTVGLSLPFLRTAIWRLGADRLFRRWLHHTEGIDPAGGYPDSSLAQHAAGSVRLYRTNIFGRSRRREILPCHVPVHQLVALRDRYVDAGVLAESEQWVEDFTRTEIDAGHWMPRTHPDGVVAAMLRYWAAR